MENNNEDMLKRCEEFLHKFNDVELSAVDEMGYPHIFGMDIMKFSTLNTMYFTTGKTTNKIRYYRNSNKAAVACSMGGECISFVGTVEIIDDDEEKYRLWEMAESGYKIDETTCEKYYVLKFTSISMTYYYYGAKGYIDLQSEGKI